MKHIIIAGGGVAAFESAVAARIQDPEAKISMFSREEVLPYRRPGLSALAAGNDAPENSFFIKSAAFFEDKNIGIELNCSIEKISPQEHSVSLSDGRCVAYDRLIIATGGIARRIPVPGADGENTFVLRDFRDLMNMRRMLADKKARVAIVGGGLLGLELADSLLKRGCEVSIIESSPTFLPRNLDAAGGVFALNVVRANSGLEILLDMSVKEITADGVVCQDRFIECDYTAFSVGVVPSIPECPGLSVNRGIVVDSSMKTNLDDIYACGDVAEYSGIPCGLYLTASKMGKTAGICAAGGCSEYVSEAYPARLNALGVKMFSVGNIAAESISEQYEDASSYRAIYADSTGNISGAVLIGDVSRSSEILKKLKH